MEQLRAHRATETWVYEYYPQFLTCQILRESSHAYPGVAVECAEFVEIVFRQLTKSLLKQVIYFTKGETAFDNWVEGPLDEIARLIDEFKLPSLYSHNSKTELKLPLVTAVVNQGQKLPFNFVNLRKIDGKILKKGAIILNLETRAIVTNDFNKYKIIFDYTRMSMKLTGWITEEVMKSLTKDEKIAILEHQDFQCIEHSPLVKLANPFPKLKHNPIEHITETPTYDENLICFSNKK